VFDRVVALDAGVQHLLSHGSVTPQQVPSLVHGCIFTRGGADLASTAIFIGGSDVTAAEALLEAVKATFFGPMRVSVMFDANGANTTAAAAVLAAGRHVDLSTTRALVLGGTGPVGQRAARLLARQGGRVTLASRSVKRATAAADAINQLVPGSHVQPAEVTDDASLTHALRDVELVIAAGAAGVCLLPEAARDQAKDLRVAIDLNAVPPAGIEGVVVTAKAEKRIVDGREQIVYGAIGVGGLKMKIHKAAIASLFTSNDKILDAEAIYALAQPLA
jgi:hypothetical protein